MGCCISNQPAPLTFQEGVTSITAAYNHINVAIVRFPEDLVTLNLYRNGLVDVSRLLLPRGLQDLHLWGNTIVDVSKLTLPAGLKRLNLFGNKIVGSVRVQGAVSVEATTGVGAAG